MKTPDDSLPPHGGAVSLAGKVQTVLGPVPAESLGVTLPHEHLFCDVTCLFDPPREASELGRAYSPFTLENLGWIRQNYFRHYENLRLTDEETAIAEVLLFKRSGGATIVDVGPRGIGRDPLALARLARATGLNIVMATGFYVAAAHPPEIAGLDVDALANLMLLELREGSLDVRVGNGAHDWNSFHRSTGVRAGIIKVGCSHPLMSAERKTLMAAARAQRASGAAITVHVGRSDRSALDIVELLRNSGADLSRVVLGHLDLRIEKGETLKALAETGCYLEFDLFGHEISHYPLAARDMPNDTMRMDLLDRVRSLGRLERILISHDICTKHRLVKYGGHGYSYLQTSIVPRLLDRGFSRVEIDTIMIGNPARVLAFAPVQEIPRHG